MCTASIAISDKAANEVQSVAVPVVHTLLLSPGTPWSCLPSLYIHGYYTYLLTKLQPSFSGLYQN